MPTYAIASASGDGQSGPVGMTLPAPVQVKVTNAGQPVANAVIDFSVAAGGGGITSAEVHTDADGIAGTRVTLGPTIGANTFLARVAINGGATVSFTETGLAGAANGIAIASGSNQASPVTSSLAPFVASVLDTHGNPVAGEPVDWALVGVGGTLSTRLGRTDGAGHSTTTLTLGDSAGAVSVIATISRLGNRTASFSATGLAGPATHIVPTHGDSQYGVAGRPLDYLAAAGRDAYENTTADQVMWTPDAGTVNAPFGVAPQVVWTLGPAPGTQSLTASLYGKPDIRYVFHAVANPEIGGIEMVSPATVQRVAGDTMPRLVARVRSDSGGPVAGVRVNWYLETDVERLVALDTSDANGLVSLKVPPPDTVAGYQGVRVRYSVCCSYQDFGIITAPTAPTHLVVVSGRGQHGVPGASLEPFVVRVLDRYNNPVPGVAMTWDPPVGGGTSASTGPVTGEDGSAGAALTLGPVIGVQSLTGHAAGIGTPVTFTAIADGGGFLVVPLTVPQAVPLQLSPTIGPGSSTATRRLAASSLPPTDELLVVYRSAPLGAPAHGSAALGAAARSRALGDGLRAAASASARRVAAPVEVEGVSPALLTARLRVGDRRRVAEAMAALRADPGVLSVEPNVTLRRFDRWAPRPRRLPADPLFGAQAWHYGMIDLPEAWTISTGSAGVLVAVVDDGARFDHPALAGVWTSDGYDFVSSNSLPLCAGGAMDNTGDGDGYDPDPTTPDERQQGGVDCFGGASADGGHGTHVAGTIGARGNDGVGVTGVAWDVRIRPVRALGVGGVGSAYDVAQGILYAAGLPADDGHGGVVQAPSAARVINLSLGGTTPSNVLQYAVESAQDAGALIVAAAGNDGNSVATYPAWYPGVIAVGALDPNGNRTAYSNFGAPTFVLAPGGDVTVAAGGGITSTAYDFVRHVAIYSGDWEGTSMATPHVTGLAALLLAQNPGLTAAQLSRRITDYASPMGGEPVPQFGFGFGAVNAWQSLTQTHAPTMSLFARIYSASTGALVGTASGASLEARFDDLPEGDYFAFAGETENADTTLPVLGRRWAAAGGVGHPTAVHVWAGRGNSAPILLAQPVEQESDNSMTDSEFLPVGGYVNGTGQAGDPDYYRIMLASPGTVTVSAGAWDGLCAQGLEAGLAITLLRSDGSTLGVGSAPGDDAGACARLTATLAAGIYYARVDITRAGRYRIQARY